MSDFAVSPNQESKCLEIRRALESCTYEIRKNRYYNKDINIYIY